MFCFLKNLLKYFLYFILGVSILVGGLLVYLIWFQPPFYFPKPTGQYAIGIKTFHWVDAKRKETYANDPEHPYRELMVNVWYPAQPSPSAMVDTAEAKLTDKPTTPYAPYFIDYYKKNKKIIWLLGLKRQIFTYAKPDSLIVQNNSIYPVIIFSHGGYGTKESNTANCEELASHGYIVVGISHTYDSEVVQFPDGRIVRTKKEKNTFLERRKEWDEDNEIWVDDTKFVVDQIEQLNKNKESIFYNRIDLKNIGIFGQSMGGSTAVQMCQRDPRIKAGVDLDGSLFGFDVLKKINKPFMFMLAGNTVKMFENHPMKQEDWKKFRISNLNEEMMVRQRYILGIEQLAKSDHDIYTFIIKNASHTDFTSNTALFKSSSFISRLLIKLNKIGDFREGSINGFRITEIVNDYLLNFFNKYLKGKPSELLDGNCKKYPEVEIYFFIDL